MAKLADRKGPGICRQANPDPHKTQALNPKLRHLR